MLVVFSGTKVDKAFDKTSKVHSSYSTIIINFVKKVNESKFETISGK